MKSKLIEKTLQMWGVDCSTHTDFEDELQEGFCPSCIQKVKDLREKLSRPGLRWQT